MPKRETVNHPDHYQSSVGVECVDVIEDKGMNFAVGSAFKYVWRCGEKHPDPLDDLKKARWYLDREIQRLEAMK